jgi:23S rRNA pseudouridine2605 synthase
MGYCSRSRAIALVRAGRVTLNGRLVRDPETPVRIAQDHIGVDGSGVEERPKVYLMMNKPRAVVTTASDEKGRATVYDLLDPAKEWIRPVGRLDKASEGLLLLTNDSTWAAKITDPASHLNKRYHVQVDRVAGDDLLARLRRGVSVGGDLLRVKEGGLCGWEARTAGWKLRWTKARTGKSAVCSVRSVRRCCGWCASR